MADGGVKDETSSATSSSCRSAPFRRRSRPIGAGHQKAAARRGERPLRHRMPAFCSAGLEARPAATRRSGHFGQCRGIILAGIQVSELRQRLSRSVNRQRLLPATLTLRLALQSAGEPAESARAVRGSVSLVRLTQICRFCALGRAPFGRIRAPSGSRAAPRMAGNTYRLRAKAAREAGYRLGSDRGSPNHGSTLASKRVMAQIWPPARVNT
jgi:hypothetical protein